MTPRLPKEVFSVLGNMPLKLAKGACPDDALGYFDCNERLVAIHTQTSKEMIWPTFWHEVTHVALYDSGVENSLSVKELEGVCDAMGTYLAAMQRAGMLRVVDRKK